MTLSVTTLQIALSHHQSDLLVDFSLFGKHGVCSVVRFVLQQQPDSSFRHGVLMGFEVSPEVGGAL